MKKSISKKMDTNKKKYKKTKKNKHNGGKHNAIQKRILSYAGETPFEEILKKPNAISAVFKQYTSMDGVRDMAKFGLGVISQMISGQDTIVELIFSIQSTISLLLSLNSIINGLLSDPRFSFITKLVDIETTATGPSIKIKVDLTDEYTYQRVHREGGTKYNKVITQDGIQKLKKKTLKLFEEFIKEDNKLPESEQAFPVLSKIVGSALQSFIIVLADWISNIVPEDDGVVGNVIKLLIQNRPDLMLEFFVNSIRLIPESIRYYLLEPNAIDKVFHMVIDQIILEIKENPVPEELQREFDKRNLQIIEQINNGKKYYFGYIVSTGMFFLLLGPGTVISVSKASKLVGIDFVSKYLISKLESVKKNSKSVTSILSTIIPVFLILFIISARCFQIENDIPDNTSNMIDKSEQEFKNMINSYTNIKYNNMVDNWFQKIEKKIY
jgi:hypothetical protein